MNEPDLAEDIKVGSLVVDKLDRSRVGVVCVAAFRIDLGPGAWVLWPNEDYEWTALSRLESASQRSR